MTYLIGLLINFIHKHWQAAVGLGGAICAWVSTGPDRENDRIKKAADAVETQVRRLKEEQGAAAAHAAVHATYVQEISAMNAAETNKAEQLIGNPEALARYIVELTGTARFPAAPSEIVASSKKDA